MVAFLAVYFVVVPVCGMMLWYIEKHNLQQASWPRLFKHLWASHRAEKDYPRGRVL